MSVAGSEAWRSWAKPSAVLVLVSGAPAAPSVLLIKRPATLREHAGQVACPGGKYEPAIDASLWETACREAFEEVGVRVPADAPCLVLDPVGTVATGYTIQPFVVYRQQPPLLHLSVAEVADAAWISFEELRSSRRISLYERNGKRQRMPEFVTHWDRVWGATALIIDDLLQHEAAAVGLSKTG